MIESSCSDPFCSSMSSSRSPLPPVDVFGQSGQTCISTCTPFNGYLVKVSLSIYTIGIVWIKYTVEPLLGILLVLVHSNKWANRTIVFRHISNNTNPINAKAMLARRVKTKRTWLINTFIKLVYLHKISKKNPPRPRPRSWTWPCPCPIPWSMAWNSDEANRERERKEEQKRLATILWGPAYEQNRKFVAVRLFQQ